MTNKTRSLWISLTVSFLLTSAQAAEDLGHVIMPDADLMIQIKLASIRQSPIFKAITQLKEEQKQKGSAKEVAGIDKTDKTIEDLRQITGLDYSDFLLLVATADLDGVGLDTPPDPSTLNALVAVELAKELPVDKLETGLKAFVTTQAKDEGKPAPTVSRVSHGDTDMIQVKEAGKEDLTCLALTNADKVLLVGPKAAVEGALDRYKSGHNTSPGSLFPSSVGKAVGRSSFYILLKPTADMLTKMESKEGDAPNPAKQMVAQLKALGLGLNFGDSLNLALVGAFPTAETANQASMMIDAQAISGIKMMLSMMTGGQPLPMLATMKTGAVKNGMVWFTMALSQADLDGLVKAMTLKKRPPAQQDNSGWNEGN